MATGQTTACLAARPVNKTCSGVLVVWQSYFLSSKLEPPLRAFLGPRLGLSKPIRAANFISPFRFHGLKHQVVSSSTVLRVLQRISQASGTLDKNTSYTLKDR